MEERLKKAVTLLLGVCSPKRIILFGSGARGQLGEHSDLDILVILDKAEDVVEESVRLRDALSPLGMPIDVVVTTQEKFDYWRETIGHLYYEVELEGKVLYETAA